MTSGSLWNCHRVELDSDTKENVADYEKNNTKTTKIRSFE